MGEGGLARMYIAARMQPSTFLHTYTHSEEVLYANEIFDNLVRLPLGLTLM